MDKIIVKKIISNISWLIFDKIFRMGLGLIIVIWQARYLGPELYGTYNYGMALVSVILVFSGLGLNGLIIKDLVENKYKSKVILGTSLAIKFSASILGYFIIIILLYCIDDLKEEDYQLVYVLGLIVFFQSTDVIKTFFESKVKSKYSVIIENVSFVIISIVKVGLIILEFPLIAFAWITVIEAILIAFGFIFIFIKKEHNITEWKYQGTYAKKLLKSSWPLIVSSMAWVIYTRLDQMMIGKILGTEAVGYYSAAIKISDIVNFFPAAIVLSIIPTITTLRKSNNKLYHQKFQGVYNITIGLMLFVAIIMSYISEPLIKILYGLQYAPTSSVLVLHIWTTIFSAMAIVSGRYLLNEGYQRITMLRHLIGVAFNIILNYILIPLYGIEGAAIASLISLFTVNFVFDIVNLKTRICFIQKIKALFLFDFFIFIVKHYRKSN